MIALPARRTGIAVAGMPAQPHGLTDRQVVGVFSDFGNRSDNFVTGNNGILGIAPFIVNDADVAMADATGVDIDFYLLGFQFSRIIGERFEFSLGFRCGIGFIMIGLLIVEMVLWFYVGLRLVAVLTGVRFDQDRSDCIHDE